MSTGHVKFLGRWGHTNGSVEHRFFINFHRLPIASYRLRVGALVAFGRV